MQIQEHSWNQIVDLKIMIKRLMLNFLL